MRPAKKKRKKRISQSLMIRVMMLVEKPNMKLRVIRTAMRETKKNQSTVKPQEKNKNSDKIETLQGDIFYPYTVMIWFFSCCYLRVSSVELYQHISDSETICDKCIFIIFIVGVNSPEPPYSLYAFQVTGGHLLINGFVDFIVCYEFLGLWFINKQLAVNSRFI
jgi:hypothetical protein